jgi:hypothetical protein
LNGDDRTNNVCEGWNSGFRKLVGEHHPSFFATISALRHDNALAETNILQFNRGHEIVGPNHGRQYAQHKARLRTLCERVGQNRINFEEFLETVGEMIRF